jgi:hypothetical protein
MAVNAPDDPRRQHNLATEDPRPGVDEQVTAAHIVRGLFDRTDASVGRLNVESDDIFPIS